MSTNPPSPPRTPASWHPPAGTVSGAMVDLYYSDSGGTKGNYLDTRNGTDPETGNAPPSIQDVCDGVRNPDNSDAGISGAPGNFACNAARISTCLIESSALSRGSDGCRGWLVS